MKACIQISIYDRSSWEHPRLVENSIAVDRIIILFLDVISRNYGKNKNHANNIWKNLVCNLFLSQPNQFAFHINNSAWKNQEYKTRFDTIFTKENLDKSI